MINKSSHRIRPHYSLLFRLNIWTIIFNIWTLHLALHVHAKQPNQLDEYCESENFEPECGPQEVIVMDEALYGRMKLGKCVLTDYGYVGCQADVLVHMDALCSGRRSCSLRIPDQALDITAPCPREFKTFLQARYGCVRVESMACQMCQTMQYAKLTEPNGYLASVVTQESNTHCGSVRCPWKIEVQPGQTINLTLWDFALEGGGSDFSYLGDACFRYAVLKDKYASSVSIPVCGGRSRLSYVYTSKKNEIEVQIVSPEVFGKKGMFMIQYEALGCPTITAPTDMWVDQKNENVAKFGCLTTQQTWEKVCKGTAWVGDVGPCPPGAINTGQSTGKNAASLPLGVLIAIIVGIALVIGVLILTIGLVYLKSHQQPAQPHHEETYRYGRALSRRYTDFRDAEPSDITPLQPLKECANLGDRPLGKPITRYRHASLPVNMRENVYMESRPLPAIPDSKDIEEEPGACGKSPQSKVQIYRTSSGKEYFHNPRLLVNRPGEQSASKCPSESDPQYFVLDPDELETSGYPSDFHQAQVMPPSKKEKSPEEENAENFSIEVASMNGSLPDLPPRIAAQQYPSNPNEYSQGKSNCSWP